MDTTATVLPATRKCNQCGREYNVRRQGKGGGLAYGDDAANFPFDERTVTGVRKDLGRGHWFNGAYCSDECYDWAYYEPTN